MNGEDEVREPSEFERAKALARERWKGEALKALVTRMDQCRMAKEQAERDLSQINAEYDVLRFELVPDQMESDGVERVVYDGIGRVSLTGDLLVSTKPGSKEGLFEWLKKRKLGDLIQPNINSSTLKAFVKGRMKAAKDVPTEYLNITPITRASITKA